MEPQTTLARETSYTGVALHTGREQTLTLRPAPAGSGIVFERTDLPGNPTVPADVAFVVSTDRSTALGRDGLVVRTVEHVLAALVGMGVDNAFVSLDGEEPPLGDGSAACFVDMIHTCGLVALDVPRRVRQLAAPVWCSRGNAHLVALPAPQLQISYTFVHDHPALGHQFAEFIVGDAAFAAEIAPARTIGWIQEVAALQARGLALGGSMDAAIVLDQEKLLTPLRFDNEVARHKILDIMGDVALVGPIAAHIIGIRSGHALHIELARKLSQVL